MGAWPIPIWRRRDPIIPRNAGEFKINVNMLLELENIYAWASTSTSHRNVIEGNRVMNANHIIKIGKNVENSNVNNVNLTALCLQTSHLRDMPHEINGIIRNNGDILSFKCSCKAGLSEKCKHIIAVLLYCSRNDFDTFETLSCTDQPCKWKKVLHSQAVTQYEPQPLDEHECFTPPLKKFILDEAVSNTLQEKIFQQLPNSAITKRKIGRHSPVVFEGEQERQVTHLEKELIREIFSEPERLLMNEICELQVDEVQLCCKTTLGQLNGDCQDICEKTKIPFADWHKERRLRITGSTCYGLFTYTKNKNPNWEKKCTAHISPKDFRTEYTEYGKIMEGKARELFIKSYEADVVETGLIVSKLNPWLGYSPDGIICKDKKPYKLLEIKCHKNGKTMTAENVVQAEVGKSLVLNNSGQLELKKKHKYYGQVQHGMAILNLDETAFVYYADFDKSLHVINVHFDETFTMQMLKSLKHMYYKFMLHKICLSTNNNENNAEI